MMNKASLSGKVFMKGNDISLVHKMFFNSSFPLATEYPTQMNNESNLLESRLSLNGHVRRIYDAAQGDEFYVENKLFDKNPKHDKYITALEPKPPDHYDTQVDMCMFRLSIISNEGVEFLKDSDKAYYGSTKYYGGYSNLVSAEPKTKEVVYPVEIQSIELEHDPGHHLIVCPASVLENWERELKKWCPSFNVLQYHGAARSVYSKELSSVAKIGSPTPFNIILVCYSLFECHSAQQNDDRKIVKCWRWSCVLMDEAHALKDKNIYRWKNLMYVVRNANQRLMVTGTPLQNDLHELWSLLEFMLHDLFENGDVDLKKLLNTEDRDLITRMKSILGPFILRRLKSDVMQQLVPKIQKVEYVHMEKQQVDAYKEAIVEYRAASHMKVSIIRRCELPRCRSQSDAVPTMSIHAVSLLFEAIFLKAKSLQALGRFTEAVQSCEVILDTVESALPEGLPENFIAVCKFQEIINKEVEFPGLWELSWALEESILSYRQALLYHWNLDMETRTKIEKDFAVFLLYSGTGANPPNLRSQMESSFVPRNKIEEAALLLPILLRKYSLKKIGWDPTLLYHPSFAPTVAGDLRSLVYHVEELPPGIIERRERYSTLALCYYGEGEDMLNNRENQSCLLGLLASKISVENSGSLKEGIGVVRKVLLKYGGRCDEMVSVTNGRCNTFVAWHDLDIMVAIIQGTGNLENSGTTNFNIHDVTGKLFIVISVDGTCEVFVYCSKEKEALKSYHSSFDVNCIPKFPYHHREQTHVEEKFEYYVRNVHHTFTRTGYIVEGGVLNWFINNPCWALLFTIKWRKERSCV